MQKTSAAAHDDVRCDVMYGVTIREMTPFFPMHVPTCSHTDWTRE